MTGSQSLIAGRYRLVEPLGQGGMGRVWLGRDERLHRAVAVKEVVAPADIDADRGRRAVREARAAARINHPNAVQVYDIVVENHEPWIVMEYLPARSLAEVVAQDGPLPPATAARVGLEVLDALSAAHAVGVLHRDVKPGNVLITPEGRAVLTDFGLATIVGDPAVTRSGLIVGSPSYLAPERAADQPVGPPSDLWSLGATMYFAVEGRSPYERSSTLATLAALANEDPPPSPRSGPLWPVLSGLLRRAPADRLDATDVRRLLQVIARPTAARAPTAVPAAPPLRVTPAPTPPRPAPPTSTLRPAMPAPRSGRFRRVPLIVVLVLLLGLAAWLVPLAVRPGASDPGAANPGVSAPAATTAPTTTAPAPTPSASDALVLPPGWHLYTDPTGFTVAVPRSWAISRKGTIVYFTEPGGGRLLGIDQTDQPQPDPVADWTGKEAYRVRRGDFPGYQRVRLDAVDYFVKAADWEFTYLRDGVRLHVNNRGFITAPDQAYGMWWSTVDAQWNAYRPDLELVQRSFRPAS